jgi:soluble lytic murein transglycosylase
MPVRLVLFALLLASPALGAPPAPRADAVRLEDPLGAVRQDLAEGEADAALDRLGVGEDRALPSIAIAPGLLGRALEAAKEAGLACDVYAADERAHPERGDAAALHLARCLTAEKKRATAAEAWGRALAGELGQEPLLLDEGVQALTALGFDDRALELAAAHLEDKPHAGDNPKRQALARALLHVARHGAGDAQARAFHRLYTELGETPAAAEARALPAFPTKKLTKDKAVALERARHLTKAHDNPGVFKTLTPFAPSAKDTSDEACEIRYLLGKASRKTRRYKTARKNLDFVAAKCGGDPERRARYLAAQVAGFAKTADAHGLFETFLAKYPRDGLADDVLVFQAERHLGDKQLAKAEASYRRVVDELPDGDMADHAHFQVAWLRAQQNDVQGARAALDELARRVSSRKSPNAHDLVTRDRALYWRARLGAFPDPATWKRTSDDKAYSDGLQALASFATARPASFYGHMARLVVQQASGEVPPVALTARAALNKKGKAPVSKALAANTSWRRARALEAAGYDELAQLFLDHVDPRKLEGGDQLVVALLYGRLGGLPRAHQVMRFSGHARLAGKPTASNLMSWDVAFPRAHEAPLFAAADEFKVPRYLLMGLSREESAFDAAVVSWAGATGLCQLMPFTADEEAERLKLPNPSQEDLRKPELNARLGAAHLARRFRLGHRLLAVAAYNAGPGNVRKWRKGWPKGRALDGWIESIPVAQTRNYVKKVTGSWVIYSALDDNLDDVSFTLVLP